MKSLPSGFTPHKPVSLENLSDLKFTSDSYYYVQPKLDGLRGIVTQRGLLSNTLKLIPNRKLQEIFEFFCLSLTQSFLEGELIVLNGTHQDAQSVVMSEDKSPENVVLICFDRYVDPAWTYESRYDWLREKLRLFAPGFPSGMLRPIMSEKVYNLNDIEKLEKFYCEQLGYEGIVIRHPKSLYKFGRATLSENTFYKYKRVDDAEAEILDTIELETNLNSLESDERGYAKRSSHKHNLVGTESAGSLLVQGINGRYEGKIFRVSLGSCTLREREWYWKMQKYNKGRIITYKFAKYRGTELAPAEPRLKGFRKDI